MIGRRELTSEDVRRLVFESIESIMEAQRKLELPICPNIHETQDRLRDGRFRAAPIPKKRGRSYQMDHGSFEPPATITLDSELPFCDRPLDLPELSQTLTHYTSTHEVIHADDHTGGDWMFRATREHIIGDHHDKLEKGLRIINGEGGCEHIRSHEDLACLWAMQYIDMITHYRAYIVLRYWNFPRLNLVWGLLRNDLFPPNLLTKIEREKGVKYIFEAIIGRAGEYCIIDALKESASISERDAGRYTV